MSVLESFIDLIYKIAKLMMIPVFLILALQALTASSDKERSLIRKAYNTAFLGYAIMWLSRYVLYHL